MRKTAKTNISFAAGHARRQAGRWDLWTGCIRDVSAPMLMESLAALLDARLKRKHREASHEAGGCAGVHHCKRYLSGSGKLAGICWGGSIVFSLNGGLFLLG